MINLQTERLKFRQWNPSDFNTFSRYFGNKETARFVGGKKSPEEAWRLMASYVGHYHLRGYSYLAFEEAATSAFAGCAGLWNSEPWPELELGYWLIPEMQGKGYATEAANCVLEFAFNTIKVDTLVSYIDPENLPSKKVAKRLGGVYEKDIELLTFGVHEVYRYR